MTNHLQRYVIQKMLIETISDFMYTPMSDEGKLSSKNDTSFTECKRSD